MNQFSLSPLEVLIALPFLLQGLAIFVDEFYFHHKRGLPPWERIGHPLDTITVLTGFAFVAYAPPTERNLWVYIGLAIFSCLFVTKDEAVHAKLCDGAESWLHAVLFILHPLGFIAAGFIWFSENFSNLKPLLFGQVLIVALFLIYQIGYWNFYAKKYSHRQ